MAVDKLVDSTQLDADLTSVANAIRTKGGTSSQLAFPSGFVSAIGDIPTGSGGSVTQDQDGYIVIPSTGGGGGDSILKAVAEGDSSLTTINDNTITKIKSGTYFFGYLTGLTSATFSELTQVNGDRLFQGSSNLQSFSAPKLTNVGSYMFRGISALTTYLLPNAETFGTEAFLGTSIQYAIFPKAKSVGAGSFSGNTSLLATDLSSGDISGTGVSMAQNAFKDCLNMKTLVIRKGNLLPLANITAFDNTPFASGGTGGILYVPSSLLSSYQSATNWSTILGYTNNQIKSIESTHTDPNAPIDLTLYYADGTPIPTT